MSKQDFSDIKDPQGYPPQYPPQQGNPQQQGYPPQYTAQQGYAPQQGYPQQYTAQQGYAPQQGYAQYPVGSNVIVTQPQSSTMYVAKPPDYLGFSIFVFLCCCWPIGIASIIYSCSSRDAFTAGDVNTAQATGSTARTLNIIGLVLGIISIILIIVLWVVVFPTAITTRTY